MPYPPLRLAFCAACNSGLSVGLTSQFAECPNCRRRVAYPLSEPFGSEEWVTVPSPKYLFGCLTALGFAITDRKRRLLHVAVARIAFDWLHDEPFRLAIETAEIAAEAGKYPPHRELLRRLMARPPRAGSDTFDARQVAFAAALSPASAAPASDLRPQTRACYADAYRDLFANPFLRLTWNSDWFTRTVRDLAAHIYADHDFGAMPILADALQDAGCDDEQVLTHCRADKPHARGCWVLDAILGKE